MFGMQPLSTAKKLFTRKNKRRIGSIAKLPRNAEGRTRRPNCFHCIASGGECKVFGSTFITPTRRFNHEKGYKPGQGDSQALSRLCGQQLGRNSHLYRRGETCFLWPFRFGRNSYSKRRLSEEQRIAASERMREMRLHQRTRHDCRHGRGYRKIKIAIDCDREYFGGCSALNRVYGGLDGSRGRVGGNVPPPRYRLFSRPRPLRMFETDVLAPSFDETCAVSATDRDAGAGDTCHRRARLGVNRAGTLSVAEIIWQN